MKDFCRRQMLREYAESLRTIKVLLLSSFGAAVIFFWILYIRKGTHTAEDVWFFVCLPLAVCALLLGFYLVVTGDGWLLRHTMFGKALHDLGHTDQAVRQINEEALDAEMTSSALLLPSYVILFSESGKPRRVCAVLIRICDVEKAVLSKGKNGCCMRFFRGDVCLGEALFQQAEDWNAAVQWMQAREINAIWTK